MLSPKGKDVIVLSSMIPEIDIDKVLKEALKRGGDFADLYLEETVNTSIICEDDRIEKVISGSDIGVGLRVIFGLKTAYAYSNRIDKRSLLDLADTLSRIVASGKGKSVGVLKGRGVEAMPVKSHPGDVSISGKVNLVEKGNSYVRGMDRRIRQVKVVYGDGVRRVLIANSKGELVEEEKTHLLYFVHVVAEENGVIQTGYEPIGGTMGLEIFEKVPPEEVARRAGERALLMLKARRAPGGRMPVVISSEAGGTMIHEAIGHGLEADLAQQGLSVFSGRIGEEVASKVVTVIDDATLPGKRGSFLYDDEGVPAQRTVLVEKGVLKGYLYDRITAMKDGVESTGNGRRESYHHRPIPRMTNTFIAPGDSDPKSIISSVEKGLFVKKMGGGQVNTVNGNFVFEVSEGYLIEKGRVGEPVRGATLTGNGPEVLKMIDMVGNDLGFGVGTCGKDGQGVPVSDAQPTLRIPEIVVGGEV